MGIANNPIKQRISKEMHTRFHWVRDRTTQKQILVYWRPGDTNLADYHTNFIPHPTTLQNIYLRHNDLVFEGMLIIRTT